MLPMQIRSGLVDKRRTLPASGLLAVLLVALPGCHQPFPVAGNIRTESGFSGTVDVRIPPATDPGPMVPTVVRASPYGTNAARVALIDVDGLILNQNLTGLYSV